MLGDGTEGLTLPRGSVRLDRLTATSAGYVERMRLFGILGVKSGVSINEPDPSGRFIPLTQIKSSAEQTHFITDMMPLLHLAPERATALCMAVRPRKTDTP